ncbi:MAG: hypothetical protein FWD53_06830 [Phycisphaerales bacterium]|nr:hypothetical protein [Phycisphaerales bacterium]
MTIMQLQIPDEVAETIRREGLLTSDGLTELLREAIRSRAFDRIAAFAAETETHGIPEMTTEEIQAEIDALRA